MVHPVGAGGEAPYRKTEHTQLTREQREFLMAQVQQFEAQTGITPQPTLHNLEEFKEGIKDILRGKGLDPRVREELEHAVRQLDQVIYAMRHDKHSQFHSHFENAIKDINKALKGDSSHNRLDFSA